MFRQLANGLQIRYFTEIVNYETKSLTVVEKEFFRVLQRYLASFDTFHVAHTRRLKRNPTLDFFASVLVRHIKYPLVARKAFQPDCIHHVLHNINSTMLFVKPRWAISVVTCHDIHSMIPPNLTEFKLHRGGLVRNLFKRLANGSFRKAELIIAVSENTKRDLINYLKIPEEKICVVYHGVNHDVFQPRDKEEARYQTGISPDTQLVLSVCSNEPRKNIETLIEAIQILRCSVPNLQLIHVGGLSSLSRHMVEEFNLGDCVRALENVPEDQLALLYNAADVFVFPSLYEGFGMPPLEAMASGCPVIASDRSSIPEVVGNGGILINPRNAGFLAATIEKVLSNSDLRTDMIQKGLSRASGFTWEKCVKETFGLYHTLWGDQGTNQSTKAN
jgi:glycosyltransferase involved in cell wall biosynthesis